MKPEDDVRQLTVRGVPASIVAAIDERARLHGLSREAEIRQILDQAVGQGRGRRETFAALSQRFLDETAHLAHTNSLPLLREDRDR